MTFTLKVIKKIFLNPNKIIKIIPISEVKLTKYNLNSMLRNKFDYKNIYSNLLIQENKFIDNISDKILYQIGYNNDNTFRLSKHGNSIFNQIFSLNKIYNKLKTVNFVKNYKNSQLLDFKLFDHFINSLIKKLKNEIHVLDRVCNSRRDFMFDFKDNQYSLSRKNQIRKLQNTLNLNFKILKKLKEKVDINFQLLRNSIKKDGINQFKLNKINRPKTNKSFNSIEISTLKNFIKLFATNPFNGRRMYNTNKTINIYFNKYKKKANKYALEYNKNFKSDLNNSIHSYEINLLETATNLICEYCTFIRDNKINKQLFFAFLSNSYLNTFINIKNLGFKNFCLKFFKNNQSHYNNFNNYSEIIDATQKKLQKAEFFISSEEFHNSNFSLYLAFVLSFLKQHYQSSFNNKDLRDLGYELDFIKNLNNMFEDGEYKGFDIDMYLTVPRAMLVFKKILKRISNDKINKKEIINYINDFTFNNIKKNSKLNIKINNEENINKIISFFTFTKGELSFQTFNNFFKLLSIVFETISSRNRELCIFDILPDKKNINQYNKLLLYIQNNKKENMLNILNVFSKFLFDIKINIDDITSNNNNFDKIITLLTILLLKSFKNSDNNTTYKNLFITSLKTNKLMLELLNSICSMFGDILHFINTYKNKKEILLKIQQIKNRKTNTIKDKKELEEFIFHNAIIFISRLNDNFKCTLLARSNIIVSLNKLKDELSNNLKSNKSLLYKLLNIDLNTYFNNKEISSDYVIDNIKKKDNRNIYIENNFYNGIDNNENKNKILSKKQKKYLSSVVKDNYFSENLCIMKNEDCLQSMLSVEKSSNKIPNSNINLLDDNITNLTLFPCQYDNNNSQNFNIKIKKFYLNKNFLNSMIEYIKKNTDDYNFYQKYFLNQNQKKQVIKLIK